MELLEQIDKAQIDKVITFSQHIENPQTENLLRDWAKAKYRLAQKFLGNKVSYTFPEKIQFELGLKAREDRFHSFITYIGEILNTYYHPLLQYLERLNFNEFYSNTLNRDYVIDKENNKVIPKGAKVVKAFKYFIQDNRLLHDLQDKASELIQENKVEGYLTFSIHPLDFLSSSENTFKWRSCHSLDGEYRAGNLSYMCDHSTMLVFLSSKKEEVLPRFSPDVSWNNKKWRMLLHFDDNLEVCFAGRQYPFASIGALTKVKEIFDNCMAPFKDSAWSSVIEREPWLGWYDDYIETYHRSDSNEELCLNETNCCVINNKIYCKDDIIKDAENSKHFNDVLNSSCYTKPYYMFKKYYSAKEKIEFTVGAPVTCLYCGEKIINGYGSMMCSDCECKYGDSNSEDYRFCDICGSRFYYAEEGGWCDGELLCPSCLEDETFVCEKCGDTCLNAHKIWNNEEQGYVCKDCY